MIPTVAHQSPAVGLPSREVLAAALADHYNAWKRAEKHAYLAECRWLRSLARIREDPEDELARRTEYMSARDAARVLFDEAMRATKILTDGQRP